MGRRSLRGRYIAVCGLASGLFGRGGCSCGFLDRGGSGLCRVLDSRGLSVDWTSCLSIKIESVTSGLMRGQFMMDDIGIDFGV